MTYYTHRRDMDAPPLYELMFLQNTFHRITYYTFHKNTYSPHYICVDVSSDYYVGYGRFPLCMHSFVLRMTYYKRINAPHYACANVQVFEKEARKDFVYGKPFIIQKKVNM